MQAVRTRVFRSSRDEFKLRPYSTYHGGVFDT